MGAIKPKGINRISKIKVINISNKPGQCRSNSLSYKLCEAWMAEWLWSRTSTNTYLHMTTGFGGQFINAVQSFPSILVVFNIYIAGKLLNDDKI